MFGGAKYFCLNLTKPALNGFVLTNVLSQRS